MSIITVFQHPETILLSKRRLLNSVGTIELAILPHQAFQSFQSFDALG